ncbi:MAG TPA: ABC transporter permease [Bryobacteraceae bacterium]|jgi:predicted permease|nr:ABC transporter permease [Bryobacteraceae bacterium]
MSWRRFIRRKYWDAERAREIQAYLEAETADNISRGMSAEDALSAARRTFGNPTLIREEIYRMNSVSWFESVLQDVRYGIRLLWTNPGFAAVAILSLALGIGANTAIFQLVDAVRLRSLPVKDPHELVEIKIIGGNRGMGLNGPHGELTLPIWQEIRRDHPPFSGVFAWGKDQSVIGEGAALEQVNTLLMSREGFRTLGIEPWRGRLLQDSDEHACPSSTVVVSHAYWQSRMGSRPIDGTTKLLVDGEMMQVVGVTPPSFFGLAVGENFDIVLPMCRPKQLARNIFMISVMGRLKPGWTISQASARFTGLSPGIMAATEIQGYDSRAVARYRQFRLGVYPASSGVSYLREAFDSSLRLLLAITGLVLLIACANIANLLLARATTREREVAVRLALGAGRLRLFRQMLVESSLLAAIGMGLGLALAQVLSRVLVHALSTQDDAVYLPTGTDFRVLFFASATALLTCLIFGIAPALRASGIDPMAAMKAGGRGATASRERFSLQRMMIVVQMSVSLLLLVIALLFVHSFYNLMTFNPGMREHGITVAFIGLNKSHLAKDRILEFQRQLVGEVQTIPGVISAATTTSVPLLGNSWTHGITAGRVENDSKFAWVSPGYFATMDIPILRGRGFTASDTGTSPRVAVVNQAFVRRFFDNADPIGQILRTHAEPDYPATIYQIVGIMPDTLYNDIRGDRPPMVLAPALQFPNPVPWTAMMIRSGLTTTAAGEAVKSRILSNHPEIIMECRSFETRIHDGLVREKMMAMLSGFFGAVAALLSMIGLYGVISYFVTRRRSEIGIRIAIGAHRGQVVAMIMREAGMLVAAGVLIGTVVAFAASRAAASLLFNLKPYDPSTFAAAAFLLAAIGALAGFIPARRASKLDPMASLRAE